MSFSSHLEEKQLKLCVEVKVSTFRAKNDDEIFEVTQHNNAGF